MIQCAFYNRAYIVTILLNDSIEVVLINRSEDDPERNKKENGENGYSINYLAIYGGPEFRLYFRKFYHPFFSLEIIKYIKYSFLLDANKVLLIDFAHIKYEKM